MCGTKAKAKQRNTAVKGQAGDRQAYRTFIKAGWGSGPWRDELDKAVWTDPATGLDCMHRRCADGGYLCGYVAVELGHPLYGFEHDAIPAALGVTAHTGLVESGLCSFGREDEVMCHTPAEGRPHDVWWFGFKCDDDGDHLPSQARGFHAAADQFGIYRSTDYVRGECAKLAARLAEIALEGEEPPALPPPHGMIRVVAPAAVRA